eukprot:3299703-Pleurochrysis_carterae.AAC.1
MLLPSASTYCVRAFAAVDAAQRRLRRPQPHGHRLLVPRERRGAQLFLSCSARSAAGQASLGT